MLKKLFGKIGMSSSVSTPVNETQTIQGYIASQSADQLLSTELRQAWLNHIWQHTSVSHEQFQRIYLYPIKQYAALVQQFPASENHHHAYLGGLLDHGLELVGHALKLRQGYLLPAGVPPEDQAVQSDAWTAAIAYAGLLHDLGKIAVDIEVELQDGSLWHPWLGVITTPYRFRYRTDRNYLLHDKAAALLCNNVIAPESLNWLCRYPELWSNFIHLMVGDYEQAGLLGEIVDKADRISTAKNIGANPEKVITAPVNSLQKKLITGLKHLIKTQLNINKTPGNGWLTPEGLWLMSKTTADSLRAYLLSQGFDGIPAKNSILFDELQSHQIIQTNPVDDRAIWTVLVTDQSRKWQQEFSLIKVNAALIWSNQEKPEYFKGNVEVIQKQNTETASSTSVLDNHQNNNTQSTAINTESIEDFFGLNELETTNTSNTTTQSSISTSAQTMDDTDDILALFGDEIMDNAEDIKNNENPNTTKGNSANSNYSNDSSVVESVDNIFTTEAVLDISNNPPRATSSKTIEDITSIKNIESVESLYTHSTEKLSFDITVEPTKTLLGEYFITWLKQRISLHKLQVNDKEAKLHLVDGQLFIVSPGIFQRFHHEHPELIAQIKNEQKEPWRVIQSSFEKLKLHVKRPDDLNIWQCVVTGPRKKGKVIKGYLLAANLFFTEFIPSNNPFITLQTEEGMK